MSMSRFTSMWQIMKVNDFQIDRDKNCDLLCTICKNLLINACNGPCGCRFCLECILQYLNGDSKPCPGKSRLCQEEEINSTTSIQIDQPINIRISRIEVKCPQISCQYRCELSLIENHMKICLNQDMNCPYQNIGCEEERLSHEKIEQHLSISNYDHIQLLMGWINNSRNEMELVKKTIAQLRSENSYLREKIEDLIFEGEKKQAKLVDMESNAKISHSEIQRLSQCVLALENKYSTWNSAALNSKDETKQISIFEFQNERNRHSEEMEKFYERWRVTEEIFDDIKQKTDVDKVNIAAEMNKISQEYNLIKEITENGYIKVLNLSSKSDSLEIKYLKLSENLCNANYGEFVWNIDKWHQKRKLAQKNINSALVSDSFYSHKNGYKMCLLVYPDGVGKTIGTHLCVFFGIMQGSFDQILEWPFKYDVKFSLMNQETGLPHVSRTVKYLNDPKCNSRKIFITNKNNAHGSLSLIRLDEFDKNPALYKNDQIFIKATCLLNVTDRRSQNLEDFKDVKS